VDVGKATPVRVHISDHSLSRTCHIHRQQLDTNVAESSNN